MNSICMKKKDTKDKSVKNRSSNSNSRSKKNSSSKNSSKHRRNINPTNNIYMKKSKEDLDFHRSISPKTINFKKTINLKTVKSGSDLIKGVIGRH